MHVLPDSGNTLEKVSAEELILWKAVPLVLENTMHH